MSGKTLTDHIFIFGYILMCLLNADIFLRLSPEVFLKRPATDNYWRLDEILKRKAVRILYFVLQL